mmetsp:Transcript_22066/g.53740  ORF Transcript_22066/g.53740 Transcript_22066/m.53740 type:complete len:520 (+) Transcript_22066:739-2298(+)
MDRVDLALDQCCSHSAEILGQALRSHSCPHLRIEIRPVAFREWRQTAQNSYCLPRFLNGTSRKLRSNQTILRQFFVYLFLFKDPGKVGRLHSVVTCSNGPGSSCNVVLVDLHNLLVPLRLKQGLARPYLAKHVVVRQSIERQLPAHAAVQELHWSVGPTCITTTPLPHGSRVPIELGRPVRRLVTHGLGSKGPLKGLDPPSLLCLRRCNCRELPCCLTQTSMTQLFCHLTEPKHDLRVIWDSCLLSVLPRLSSVQSRIQHPFLPCHRLGRPQPLQELIHPIIVGATISKCLNVECGQDHTASAGKEPRSNPTHRVAHQVSDTSQAVALVRSVLAGAAEGGAEKFLRRVHLLADDLALRIRNPVCRNLSAKATTDSNLVTSHLGGGSIKQKWCLILRWGSPSHWVGPEPGLCTKSRAHGTTTRSSEDLTNHPSATGYLSMIPSTSNVTGVSQHHDADTNVFGFRHRQLHCFLCSKNPQCPVPVHHSSARCLSHHPHIRGRVLDTLPQPGCVLLQHVAHPV